MLCVVLCRELTLHPAPGVPQMKTTLDDAMRLAKGADADQLIQLLKGIHEDDEDDEEDDDYQEDEEDEEDEENEEDTGTADCNQMAPFTLHRADPLSDLSHVDSLALTLLSMTVVPAKKTKIVPAKKTKIVPETKTVPDKKNKLAATMKKRPNAKAQHAGASAKKKRVH